MISNFKFPLLLILAVFSVGLGSISFLKIVQKKPEPKTTTATTQLPPLTMIPWVCRPQSLASHLSRLRLDDATTSAVQFLATEELYAHGLIGEAAMIAPADARFNHILDLPDAPAIFLALYEARETTTAGRLHALRGLCRIDRQQFDAIANRLQQCHVTVHVMRGCLITQKTVSEVVREMAEARYVNPLIQP